MMLLLLLLEGDALTLTSKAAVSRQGSHTTATQASCIQSCTSEHGWDGACCGLIDYQTVHTMVLVLVLRQLVCS